MKKILLITFFGSLNYGQVLQNYALQTAVEDLGYRAETLKYQFIPISDYTRLWAKKPDSIGKCVKKIARYILFYRRMLSKISAFQSFRTAYLSLTEEMTRRELPAVNGRYDVYIVGSDQIWNIDVITEDEVDTYTLQFVRDGKRAAYGASAGSSRNITPPLVARVSTLDYISVREHSLKERLEQSGLTGIHDVCDPVLLLEEERWRQLPPAASPLKKPYVFVYFLYVNDIGQDLRKLATTIAEERGLKICHVDRRVGFGTSRYGISPIEWLSYIAHAEVTALASFHGLAFSIIFEKEFIAIHNPKTGDRTRELLEALGLSDRGFDSYEDYCLRKDSIRPIDWRAVKEKLAELRKRSLDVLRDICDLPERHV